MPQQSHECIISHADAAEEALQQGLVDVALAAAKAALQKQTSASAAEPPDDHQLQAQARALNVLIQADFHFHNRLTDLQAALSEHAISLSDLPVSVVLLWCASRCVWCPCRTTSSPLPPTLCLPACLSSMPPHVPAADRGVVAVELQAGDAARRVLSTYLSGKDFGDRATGAVCRAGWCQRTTRGRQVLHLCLPR
jgi:hypothetical protein